MESFVNLKELIEQACEGVCPYYYGAIEVIANDLSKLNTPLAYGVTTGGNTQFPNTGKSIVIPNIIVAFTAPLTLDSNPKEISQAENKAYKNYMNWLNNFYRLSDFVTVNNHSWTSKRVAVGGMYVMEISPSLTFTINEALLCC